MSDLWKSSAVSKTTTRTYTDALALLDSLQSNEAIRTTISKTHKNINQYALPEMLEWTKRAGYDVSDFAQQGLKCIHVAGTKGKGSVCAMVENMLLQYRTADSSLKPTGSNVLGKIGLYTSPHLITVRERIRIDGFPISESLFTRYFFELWDRFSQSVPKSSFRYTAEDDKPGYFRFLTLLAFHTFLKEGVQSAIIECGIGGEYDSTNILPTESVTVTAITRLGKDHVGMLGSEISKIAWHKAGIMKKSVPAFSVPQLPEAESVLISRAYENDVRLEFIRRHPALDSGKVKLGLEGDFQKDNASLAIAIAESHLKSMERMTDQQAPGVLKDPIIRGLENVQWPGRCQVLKDENIEWLIDGAHTTDSIEAVGQWYMTKIQAAFESSNPPTSTMLVFNCHQERDICDLLSHGDMDRDIHFDRAVFCTNTPFKTASNEKPELIELERARYAYLNREFGDMELENIVEDAASICPSVEEAVQMVRTVSEGKEKVFVLVTGSLYLAGALLQVLESPPQKS
ncbi:Mur ligase [Bisporella sp. PMI_857]|nr:Mur ligase [Bisporella sp. PMI_857]